jgi:hypothetical protein
LLPLPERLAFGLDETGTLFLRGALAKRPASHVRRRNKMVVLAILLLRSSPQPMPIQTPLIIKLPERPWARFIHWERIGDHSGYDAFALLTPALAACPGWRHGRPGRYGFLTPTVQSTTIRKARQHCWAFLHQTSPPTFGGSIARNPVGGR